RGNDRRLDRGVDALNGVIIRASGPRSTNPEPGARAHTVRASGLELSSRRGIHGQAVVVGCAGDGGDDGRARSGRGGDARAARRADGEGGQGAEGGAPTPRRGRGAGGPQASCNRVGAGGREAFVEGHADRGGPAARRAREAAGVKGREGGRG